MFTIQLNSIQTIKENIMTYFNGTLQKFTYLHEQVTEISNLDESYLGTLNLFFKEPVTSNDEQIYFEESDAFEQYVKDYINNNIIPDYTTLISITTIDNPDQDGIHILTFLKNDPEHFDDDDTASITCIECLRDTFAYDPEACFGQAPIITEFNSFFTVSIPYNY